MDNIIRLAITLVVVAVCAASPHKRQIMNRAASVYSGNCIKKCVEIPNMEKPLCIELCLESGKKKREESDGKCIQQCVDVLGKNVCASMCLNGGKQESAEKRQIMNRQIMNRQIMNRQIMNRDERQIMNRDVRQIMNRGARQIMNRDERQIMNRRDGRQIMNRQIMNRDARQIMNRAARQIMNRDARQIMNRSYDSCSSVHGTEKEICLRLQGDKAMVIVPEEFARRDAGQCIKKCIDVPGMETPLCMELCITSRK